MNKTNKNKIIVLSSSHDVLVVDRKEMTLPSFQVTGSQPIELDLRDFLTKKLSASLVCVLGVFVDDHVDYPVVLIDDSDFDLPKKTWWIPVDKFLGKSPESDLFKKVYFNTVLGGHKLEGNFSVWPMGENELDASILGLMVANGRKMASSSLLVEYTKGEVTLPKKDNESVIIDWSGRVICTIRTTDVKIVPFNKVDDSHAANEMIGDGSLAYWQDVYWDLFDQVYKGFGDEADEEMDVVCESFEVTKSFT
ncbi:ASCH domain-containing protein [bacterium]|nr:ASCH domain-containing protein [bacterium]